MSGVRSKPRSSRDRCSQPGRGRPTASARRRAQTSNPQVRRVRYASRIPPTTIRCRRICGRGENPGRQPCTRSWPSAEPVPTASRAGAGWLASEAWTRTESLDRTTRRAPRDADRSISSLLSRGNFSCLGARDRARSAWPAGGRRVEFGVRVVTSPKRRWFRCEPATQASETFLRCPARARWSSGGDALGVGDEVPPDDVAEPPLQRADRFARGLPFGERAVVVAAAGAVRVTDLGDRGDVQRVVESAVAAP